MAIDIDIEEYNPMGEYGNKLPIGKHRVFLHDATEVERNDKRVQVLSFEVAEGEPGAGRKIKASLYETGKDSDATKVCHEQICKYARVLGILERYEKTPGDPKSLAYRYCEGHTEIDFTNVIGAEAVIDVIHREGKDSAGKPTGEVYVEPKMFGIMTVQESAEEDAKKTEKAEKGKSGGKSTAPRVSPTNGAPGKAPPVPRQLDTSDL